MANELVTVDPQQRFPRFLQKRKVPTANRTVSHFREELINN